MKNKQKTQKKSAAYLRTHCGRVAEVSVIKAVKVAQHVAARFAKKKEDSRPIIRQKKIFAPRKFCHKPKDRSAVLSSIFSEVCGPMVDFSNKHKLPIKLFAVPSFNLQARSEQVRSEWPGEDKKIPVRCD